MNISKGISIVCFWLAVVWPVGAATGGMEYWLKIEAGPGGTTVATEEAITALQKRLKRFEFMEFHVQARGSNVVAIQIFDDVNDQKEAILRRLIGSATLEFRLVHAESSQLLAQGITPPLHEKLSETIVSPEGRTNNYHYLVAMKPAGGLSERHIAKAYVEKDRFSGKPQIAFALTSEGARIFGEVTTENVGRQLAIVLNKNLCSAPKILEPITGGHCQITGSFTQKEAEELAALLDTPMTFSVKLLEERVVAPAEVTAYHRRGLMKMTLLATGGFALVVLVIGGAFLIIRRLT